MAQRAYRSRKETTITSLEKQVQDLRGTNEEMSNIFVSLYDFAVGRGLHERDPEFGRQLKSTTQRFLELAKASSNDDDSIEESHIQSSTQHKNLEPAPMKKNSRASTKKTQKDVFQDPEVVVQPWGGYTVTKEDSPMEEVSSSPFDQPAYQERSRHNDVQVITRPTEDNASFPFDFTDLQQYRVELPTSATFSHAFLPMSQPSLPMSHSYNEYSFARRIQRGSMERAIVMLSLEHPPKQRFQEAFGFTLMYQSKEALLARLKRALAMSSKDTLHDWSMPFLHTGGSGTYYPIHDDRELMPKFRTGYSMGPFTSLVSEVEDAIQDDLRCNVPGFGGDFFDSNDVEGYLRGRGLEIPPAADYVTAEIDFSEISSPLSAASSESESLSPVTPQSPAERGFGETAPPYTYDFSKPEGKAFPFPLDFTNWTNDVTVSKGTGNIDPIFNTMPTRDFDGALNGPLKKSVTSERRVVTINVKVLLEGKLNVPYPLLVFQVCATIL